MYIVDPTNCEFAKMFSYLLFTERHSLKKRPAENCEEYKSCIARDQYERFLSQFKDYPKTVDCTKFKSNFRNMVKNIQTLSKEYPEKKTTLLTTFTSVNWDKLNQKKSSHSLFDYQVCLRSSSLNNVLSMFKSVSNLHKAKENV